MSPTDPIPVRPGVVPSTSPPSSSNRQSFLDRYVHDTVTNTWVVKQQPPPIPPKLPHHIPITKETQNLQEPDGASGSSTTEERTRRRRSEPPQGSENETTRAHVDPPVGKKRKLRILSLDGGGIRGYSTLLILEELMHQIYVRTHNGRAPKSPDDLPRPCDYFDLIGGNGTGGLIALMLGRLRMNIEACKEYYHELTRYVFITDKTLMGIPYGKTLFKASRLEEAIRYVVDEATTPKGKNPATRHNRPHSIPHSPASQGDPYALLLDPHPRKCHTLVTAMYQGSGSNAPGVLLRTYPSRSESVPSYKTTIVQAGRATSATLAAFKPVTIGQNTFLDEGGGKCNPTIQLIAEAQTEFAPCEVSVIVSIGTGKRHEFVSRRSSMSHCGSSRVGERKLWWEGVKGFDTFTEARRRLLSRIDDCENIHQDLLSGPRLTELGMPLENYFRLNVECGVGEFEMNEWSRLQEVSTNTRIYLQKSSVAKSVAEAAEKLIPPHSPPPQQARSPKSRPQPQHKKSMSNPSALGIAELAAEIDTIRESFSPPAKPHRNPAAMRRGSFSPPPTADVNNLNTGQPQGLRQVQSHAELPPRMPDVKDFLPNRGKVAQRASSGGMREKFARPLRGEEWGYQEGGDWEVEEEGEKWGPDIRVTSPTTVMEGDVGEGGGAGWDGRT
ncbi:hypothetical protein RUND412_002890 [Rhizina undulata]